MRQLADTTQDVAGQTKQIVSDTRDVRDHIADFDDFFRPVRGYFHWDSTVSISPSAGRCDLFDALDGVDKLTDWAVWSRTPTSWIA